MMKKFLTVLLALVMLLSIVACRGSGDNGGGNEGGETTSASGAVGRGDDPKSEGTVTYAEYIEAEIGTAVQIEAYVQAATYWRVNKEDGAGKITVYLQDCDGAYLVQDMICTEADAAKLTRGARVRVTGDKAVWNGRTQVDHGAFELISGETFIAAATDLSALLGTEELVNHQNKRISFKGMTVEAISEEEDLAFFYRWDNSGSDGDDLYFIASDGKETYTFTVESDLMNKDSDVYKAVKALKIGDKIDMEGFLYWNEGARPHITSVTAAS